ncbi:MAG: MFS transporter [Treponema sp.]|jgi:NNP family nitrate/nitrite transporter-like MFS transporter|nr:MFS transporter [Treponema sp.]
MSNTNSNYRWVILGIACIAIFAPNYAQYQLPPLATQIIHDLQLTPSRFSGIFTAPMIPAIFLSIAAGLLADKFGVKRVIAVGLLISAAGTWLRIMSNSYVLLFFSMVLSGFGAAFLNTNGAKVLGSWFPPEKLGTAMGIFLGASTLAMTAGMGTTAMLSGKTAAYTISAVICSIAFVLWVLCIKTPQQETQSDNTPITIPILECLGKVLKNKTVWLAGVCLMFIMGAVVIISSFLPAILAERKIDAVSAGAYGSAVTIGNLLGCLFIPLMAGRLGKNKPWLYMLALIAAAGAAFSWQTPQGPVLALSLCLTGIAMGGLMPFLMSMPIQLPEIGPAYAGTAGGFIATLQLLGAVVIPTYIVGPIAGTDLRIFFLAAGICMILVFIFTLGLPELGQKKVT